jgi:hypothetical protein
MRFDCVSGLLDESALVFCETPAMPDWGGVLSGKLTSWELSETTASFPHGDRHSAVAAVPAGIGPLRKLAASTTALIAGSVAAVIESTLAAQPQTKRGVD